MGKHRNPAVKKWGPYVTTGIALEAATLFAFAYATDSHVAVNPLLAATTSIFVDGTKSITGNEEGNPPYRMADSFLGRYDQAPGMPHTSDDAGDKFITYSRSLGPLTGLGSPTYDVSEAEATTNTVAAIRAARLADPDGKIIVVGYSQGAGAASEAIGQLEADPTFDTSNVEFVLAANPRRNDGGILTRFPPGVYVPVLGVTFGDGTSPTKTNVLQVTKQYDGVGDAPKYVFNVLADVNAAMGYYYLHPGYYKTIDPSTEPADDRIISTSADGRITDVLIKAPIGELPITMPLLQLGVPKSVVAALDPLLRAIIETGYDRPVGTGAYPSTPVPFQLVPPAGQWASDVQSVASGAAQTGKDLAGAAAAPKTDDATASRTTLARKPQSTELPEPKPTPTTTPTPTPMKFEPPRLMNGSWKPGDLLRQFFTPTPTTTTTTSSSPGSTTPSTHASPPPSTPPTSTSADAAQDSGSPTTP